MKKIFTTLRSRHQHKIAVTLLLSMLIQILLPLKSFAGSGPTQPEFTGFTPAGTTDMVDLATGDFSYNIPLLDVGGYPVNMCYSGGIGMEQEATWVGLGWNLNCGAINRSLRGLPDDFNGDVVKKEMNIRPNRTWGVTGTFNGEVFGAKLNKPKTGKEKVTPGISIGLTYNNYHGIGTELIFSPVLSGADKAGNNLKFNVELNNSSQDGLSVKPNGGLYDEEKQQYKANLALNFNTREGLKNISWGINTDKKIMKTNLTFRGSYNLMQPTYTPVTTNNYLNTTLQLHTKFGGKFMGVSGDYDVSGYYSVQSLQAREEDQPAYGYMYAQNAVKQPCYAQCYDDSATDEHCSLTSNFCVKLDNQTEQILTLKTLT